ncbi:RsiW-degrading membrane proteinase PrsW (M82 family) [Klugiella xanthotipulae]|uniref:RsiW-degrading membrane proteinase PrsW (M82 family) n=1 Tax=Klugiella xanthotipulae TaxID=244735 RepID=A0A543I4L9_9MICO|nr:RsiW-degrading membrane proteinase PrsW (M82 family) [Klugiella xanthotipulae]
MWLVSYNHYQSQPSSYRPTVAGASGPVQPGESRFIDQPVQAPVHLQAAPATAPMSSPAVTWLAVVVVGLVALVFLSILALMGASIGPEAAFLCAVLALIPLAIVLCAVRWIDRWEPEPRLAMLFAFLWGAGASVAMALLVDLIVQVSSVVFDVETGEFVGAVFQAPVVEEMSKGLGILVVVLVWRKTFDGVVDGLVYGITIAAGFAFTENILYFGEAYLAADASLTTTFVMRGLLSPFAHAMFTACTGFAVGFAASRGGGVRVLGYFLAGLSVAILLHALWNGSTYIDFFLLYVVVQMPLFALSIFIVFYVRQRERMLTERRLGEYAAVGWFTPEEVWLLATRPGRRQARAWARGRGGQKQRLMGQLIRDSTRLAYTRQRIATGRDMASSVALERELLGRVTGVRAELAAG